MAPRRVGPPRPAPSHSTAHRTCAAKATALGTKDARPPSSERRAPPLPNGEPVMSARRAPTALHGLLRVTRSASALLAAWLPAPAVPSRTAAMGRVREIADFGSNPGGLRMLVYAPPRLPADAPL